MVSACALACFLSLEHKTPYLTNYLSVSSAYKIHAKKMLHLTYYFTVRSSKKMCGGILVLLSKQLSCFESQSLLTTKSGQSKRSKLMFIFNIILLVAFVICLAAFIFVNHLKCGEKLLLFVLMLGILVTFLIVCFFDLW